MASLIPGYEYDIFISYRQKDNKYDGWVTEFVDNLKKELEATFKEEISVYFDINPHDGLLETHDVDASLKDKLKCLIFIPIISRTYCDPKSFAWEHEFKTFIEQASEDQFGLKVKLPNGNVASRVLPVRIHDLDNEDIKLCESVLGGVLRGVEFIYGEPGVNRPLKSDDDEKINLNKTKYRNQINKLGNAVKEIFSGIKTGPAETENIREEVISIKEQITLKDKSIIVLPFENLSPDPDQEYFSDGLTEEIITELSHIDDFLVISRSSAMTFKGTNKTLPEIAMMVNVHYVLEGSVRKSGNNLRITAQLIDALTDRHLWAEKYAGTLDDIFDIQESVSRKIVLAIKGRFTQKDRQKLLSLSYAQNTGVYEVYSRAHYEFWKYESGNLDKALNLLEEAITIFGEHPLLLSGIGAIHWQIYHYRGDLDENHLIRIKECSDSLLAIDCRSAPGNRLKSYIALHNGNVDDAIRYLKKAIDIDPADTETLLWFSYLLTFHAGRASEAQPVAENWKAIDPLHPLSGMTLGVIKWMNADLEGAARDLEYWHRKEPDDPIYSFYLGHILTWMGDHKKALLLAEEMFLKNPDEFMGQTLRFLTLSVNGKREEAKSAVTAAMREVAWMDFHLPWLMAEGYSILGEIDEALLWFDRSVEKGYFNYPLFNGLDPLLANIRNHPRFIKTLERIKHKWQNFEF